MTAVADTRSEWAGPEPPQDLDAERAALGGMLLSKDAVLAVAEEVREEDFYRPAHQAIFAAIMDLFSDADPVDPITVAAELERRRELSKVGGAPYLHTLIETTPTTANAAYYAELVRRKSTRRHLLAAGQRIIQFATTTSDDDVDTAVAKAEGAVSAVSARDSGKGWQTLDSLMQPTMDELDALQEGKAQRGVPTGILDLDAVLTGLHPGQLIIVAARPGIGKSTLALDFCRSAAIHNKMTTALYSLEMSAVEINTRLLSAEAKVRLADMRGGRMTDADWARLARTAGEVADAPLVVDDTATINMSSIRASATRLKREQDLRMIVVDYLQLMSSGKKVESRQQEVSEFSRQLKLLAKELHVPVVALSQLNRGPEQRQDKRPMLADLRESGSLEQDADVVILMSRPDAAERDDPRAGEADLILAKHRSGPTATIAVAHQLHYSRFADLARGQAPPPMPSEQSTWSPTSALDGQRGWS